MGKRQVLSVVGNNCFRNIRYAGASVWLPEPWPQYCVLVASCVPDWRGVADRRCPEEISNNTQNRIIFVKDSALNSRAPHNNVSIND